MSDFSDLPQPVRAVLLGEQTGKIESDYEDQDFTLALAAGYNGLWAAPALCYDFQESNYTIFLVNLREVFSLDVGPAMATIYEKINSSEPSWIVVDPDSGDTDFQVIECV